MRIGLARMLRVVLGDRTEAEGVRQVTVTIFNGSDVALTTLLLDLFRSGNGFRYRMRELGLTDTTNCVAKVATVART
ncbi:hypothetical protein PHSY_006755 [Pseudozyma hubeiensis SY62]|uniref:Uncharacterized protein n=1 Tax=Pseudozyma hubeiensis (strain SY62) TaxID=1305764 RepID=R9PCR1_PSEHS|nr:hypothetical protein PHSY_006755 [Pseudozyma hubeiensis SY62]GAC99156.1 hypothetical protein PHSY_006755 [Pseudozyma hubeiensis SY62]